MNRSPDRLYDLLPVVHQQRDAEQGFPLRALLRVISEQVNVLEDDIAQMYENWFVETCEEWVVPYIGDLVGYHPVQEAGQPGDPRLPQEAIRNSILVSRREVANTLRSRRRKGTLALLKTLAEDVAGWPARAVEFYKLAGWTQHVKHVRWPLKTWHTPAVQGGTVDLRQGAVLALLDSPFDTLTHTVDVRRIASARRQGRVNLPNIGLFVWRLQPYTLTQAPAYCYEEVGPQCYLFNVLGVDTRLFHYPQPETEPTHNADEINLPTPIRRRAFEGRAMTQGGRSTANPEIYGVGRSLAIFADDWPKRGAPQPIPAENILPADLSDWRVHVPANFVAVDPETGRFAFPTKQTPRSGVRVSFVYAFSADIGGGEYERSLSHPDHAYVYFVTASGQKTAATGPKDSNMGTAFSTISEAIHAWEHDRDTAADRPTAVVIEIADSKVYTEPLEISLPPHESFQLRAANGCRPVLDFLNSRRDRPDPFHISGGEGSRITLDGLLIAGRGLLVTRPDVGDNEGADGDLCELQIRHCTLVPGWNLDACCEPENPNEASLELIQTRVRLRISESILGTILVVSSEIAEEPLTIEITDSILDATSRDNCALGARDQPLAHAILTIARSTVFGQVQTHAIALAENSLFTGTIQVARRQFGCMRFCASPFGSRTPRRYHCQPDLVTEPLTDETEKENERLRVRPLFTSEQYGASGYAQLRVDCAVEIRQGADDESEMGVFHDLFQPQRLANLQARLEEFTPEDMEAGIFFAN